MLLNSEFVSVRVDMTIQFVGYVLLAGFAPLLAASVPILIFKKKVPTHVLVVMLGLSAGILFSIATMDLIPEGMSLQLEQMNATHTQESVHEIDVDHPPQDEHNHDTASQSKVTMLGVGCGFIGLLLAQLLLSDDEHGGHSHVHEDNSDGTDHEGHHAELGNAAIETNKELSSHFSNVAFLGLAIHSFVDGVVMAGAFSASFVVGARVALAVVVHKFPDGFVLSSLFVSASQLNDSGKQSSVAEINKKRILFSWVLGVCAMTPLGAVVGSVLLSGISTETLAFILGFGAGSFLFVGCSGIIPELLQLQRKMYKVIAMISFFGGYLLFVLSETLLHAH